MWITLATLLPEISDIVVLVVIPGIYNGKEGLGKYCFKRELEDHSGVVLKVEATLAH